MAEGNKCDDLLKLLELSFKFYSVSVNIISYFFDVNSCPVGRVCQYIQHDNCTLGTLKKYFSITRVSVNNIINISKI